MVLEVPQGRSPTRVHSHVLYTQGNEIFMHSLNFAPKPNLDERILEQLAIDDSAEKIKDYRKNVN